MDFVSKTFIAFHLRTSTTTVSFESLRGALALMPILHTLYPAVLRLKSFENPEKTRPSQLSKNARFPRKLVLCC